MFENYTPNSNQAVLFENLSFTAVSESNSLSEQLTVQMHNFEQYLSKLFDKKAIRSCQKHYLALFAKQYYLKFHSFDKMSDQLNISIHKWKPEEMVMAENTQVYTIYFYEYDIEVSLSVVTTGNGVEIFYFK